MQEENLWSTPALCTGFTIRWEVDMTDPHETGMLHYSPTWSKRPEIGADGWMVTLINEDRQLMRDLVPVMASEWDHPGANRRMAPRLSALCQQYYSAMVMMP